MNYNKKFTKNIHINFSNLTKNVEWINDAINKISDKAQVELKTAKAALVNVYRIWRNQKKNRYQTTSQLLRLVVNWMKKNPNENYWRNHIKANAQ